MIASLSEASVVNRYFGAREFFDRSSFRPDEPLPSRNTFNLSSSK